jgi:hypothetical protein
MKGPNEQLKLGERLDKPLVKFTAIYLIMVNKIKKLNSNLNQGNLSTFI